MSILYSSQYGGLFTIWPDTKDVIVVPPGETLYVGDDVAQGERLMLVANPNTPYTAKANLVSNNSGVVNCKYTLEGKTEVTKGIVYKNFQPGRLYTINLKFTSVSATRNSGSEYPEALITVE